MDSVVQILTNTRMHLLTQITGHFHIQFYSLTIFHEITMEEVGTNSSSDKGTFFLNMARIGRNRIGLPISG